MAVKSSSWPLTHRALRGVQLHGKHVFLAKEAHSATEVALVWACFRFPRDSLFGDRRALAAGELFYKSAGIQRLPLGDRSDAVQLAPSEEFLHRPRIAAARVRVAGRRRIPKSASARARLPFEQVTGRYMR
ncbi:MAG: hypothetical protein ACRECZ_02565 [Methylocella sp.]